MRLLLPILLVAACAGADKPPAVEAGPDPEPVTRATLAGPLCEGDRCQCRQIGAGDGGAGAPEGGDTKRFEFHLGPSTNALWATVDDMVLYKSDERAEECFYVDLAPGQHKVTLRANRGGGFAAQLDIHEYGPLTQSWYDTFTFVCGPGACSYDDLDAWKESLARYRRGLHDPCGSTKVKGITWDAGRAPDQQHPQSLVLELTLDVYKFAPGAPHGDPSCKDRIAE